MKRFNVSIRGMLVKSNFISKLDKKMKHQLVKLLSQKKRVPYCIIIVHLGFQSSVAKLSKIVDRVNIHPGRIRRKNGVPSSNPSWV